MSKMGNFILDVQTIVCEKHGSSLEEVKREVHNLYADSGYADLAEQVAEQEFLTIHGDLEEWERMAYDS